MLIHSQNTEKEKSEAAEENGNKRPRKVTFEDELKDLVTAQVSKLLLFFFLMFLKVIEFRGVC